MHGDGVADNCYPRMVAAVKRWRKRLSSLAETLTTQPPRWVCCPNGGNAPLNAPLMLYSEKCPGDRVDTLLVSDV